MNVLLPRNQKPVPMIHWWVFILNLLLCLSCSQKKTNTERDYAKDSGTQGWYLINPIYRNGNSFYNKERKKIIINKNDLLDIDAIVKKQLMKLNDAMPFEYYYRQYVGYMENNNIYVYINLFSYLPTINGLTPDVGHTIIILDDGNYNWGYMIINYKTGKVIECKFDE